MFRFTLPRLFAAIAIVAFLAWVVGHFYRDHKAEQQLHDLVRGDESIQLSALRIDNQGRRVLCTDPKLLAYFADCLRQSSPYIYLPGGISYRFTVGFADGSQTTVDGTWDCSDRIGLSIPRDKPSDYGLMTRGFIFQQPIPTEVAKMLKFLDKDWREVKGQVMILQSGGNRWDFDPKL